MAVSYPFEVLLLISTSKILSVKSHPSYLLFSLNFIVLGISARDIPARHGPISMAIRWRG